MSKIGTAIEEWIEDAFPPSVIAEIARKLVKIIHDPECEAIELRALLALEKIVVNWTAVPTAETQGEVEQDWEALSNSLKKITTRPLRIVT